MKIRYAYSNGKPQMIVLAETEQDYQVIKTFIHFGEQNQDQQFCLHGYIYSDGNILNFNFGYRKKTVPKKWFQFWKK